MIPIMYMVWSSVCVPLTHAKTRGLQTVIINDVPTMIAPQLNYDDVPLSFFKNEMDIEKKHGRAALERYLKDGERPPRMPKDHKQRIKIQVNAPYSQLRKEAGA